MKKKLSVIVSLILAINCMNLGLVVYGADEISGEQLLANTIAEEEQECESEYEIQSEQIAKCYKIKKHFGNFNSKHFGGVYINNKNRVVVNMTHKNNSDSKYIKTVGDDVVVTYSTYSYSDLQEMYDFLNLKLNELTEKDNEHIITEVEKDALYNIVKYYVSVEDNCIYMCLKNIDNDSIETFKKQFVDSDIIKFIQSDEKIEENATTLKLGRGIYVDYGKKGVVAVGSIGIKAYYINSSGDKVHGFITAGHVAHANGNKVYASSNTSNKEIGKVVKYRYKNGKVDAAFVKVTNNNYKISNQVYYSN